MSTSADSLPGAYTTPSKPSDPIGLELFKNAISSIADEMALTVLRTSYSGVLKDNMDFSTGLTDSNGKLVALGLTVPAHLGSIPSAMEAIFVHYRNEIHPGDVFIMNDPFDGGMHLPDIFVVKPLYHAGSLAAFAATVCHHSDVGGRVAGSNAADSTEIYAEGLRLTPLKLYDKGELNSTLMKIIEKNVRLPLQVAADLRAQLAACHIAEKQFTELIARHGLAEIDRMFTETLDHAERLTRSAIEALPDGEWSFEDWLDDDGVDLGKPVRIFVTVRKLGSHIVADWTGSAAQVRGAINCTLSITKAAAYTCVRSVLPLGIPNNEGVFRAIDVVAPPGTVTNAILPAAVAARGVTAYRMVDCMFGALAMMLPDKVNAAGDGGGAGVAIGGYYADRKPFVFVEFTGGTWGARPWADGLGGNSHIFANMCSRSVESTEAEHPVSVLCYEYAMDKAGEGKFRSGVPVRRDCRFNEARAVLQVRTDRHQHRSFGLYGGNAGQPSENVLNPQTEGRALTGKFTMEIKHGDVFRHVLAGGGGWGDPLERDPAAVLKDVRNELVSLKKADSAYGVVLDAVSWRVDAEATKKRRAQLREARGWSRVPEVQR